MVTTTRRDLKTVPIEKIKPNPKNPRQADSFKPAALERLRMSIRTHGVLEPLIVMQDPTDPDDYLLIEGERRLRTGQLEGLTVLPVVVIDSLDEQNQVITMFNIHGNRKGWEMAEELVAVKEIVERNGHRSDADLAAELGMTVATFRDRLAVLKMGDEVVDDIAADRVEYSAALRSNQAATTIARKRPKLADKLGGADAVRQLLLTKARNRKRGLTQELVQARADLGDPAVVPDVAVERYLTTPETEWREVLHTVKPAADRRRVRELAKRLAEVEREMRDFDPKALDGRQLGEVRSSLMSLMTAGQDLEQRIVDALLERN